MRIGTGDHTYEWIDNWARIPNTDSGKANGRTHGVVVTEAGQVIVFNQAKPGVLVFDQNGNLQHSWGDQFGGAHGMTLIKEASTEYLWITDQVSSAVVKTTLDGQTVMSLPPPDLQIYRDGGFVPTWVAARLAMLDADDKLVCYLGENEQVCDIPGWPNHLPQLLKKGRFNSPHAVAADRARNLYVVEWIIGGRITKLVKCQLATKTHE